MLLTLTTGSPKKVSNKTFRDILGGPTCWSFQSVLNHFLWHFWSILPFGPKWPKTPKKANTDHKRSIIKNTAKQGPKWTKRANIRPSLVQHYLKGPKWQTGKKHVPIHKGQFWMYLERFLRWMKLLVKHLFRNLWLKICWKQCMVACLRWKVKLIKYLF